MTYQINSTKSKSGKRTLFFVTVNGKRVSKTNFARKWEAEYSFKQIVEIHGEDKITAWANS